MTSSEIRRQFIDFFREKGHTFEPSALVVPHDDPTLLFTNAGMNQFKDVFLGTGTRKYTRAVNTQKCIRAGGKHNDLDDVGHDTYHHTFFEMLGNWSFGDYFKAEAIEWAWELLVERWGLEPDRLHATYFEGDSAEGLEPDIESRDLWLKILPPERVHPGNKKDNFWEMGETGPCGPCSEIHIDLTPDKSGASLVNAGEARVMEIWNLVFIQFNRDAAGKLSPLPAKHVDTGLGFERVTALLQKKTSNYDTDIFTPIFDAIREVTGAEKYTGLLESDLSTLGVSPGHARGYVEDAVDGISPADGSATREQVMKDVAYRVIADHLRCLVFAITDGATLSNVGRGYVLRRILRRAVRYGRQHLDAHDPFLHKLVPTVIETMGEAFPELRKKRAHVGEMIHEEEESFIRTYERGVRLFDSAAKNSILDVIYNPILPSGTSSVVGRVDPLIEEAVDYPEPDRIVVPSPETGRLKPINVPAGSEGQREVIEKHCERAPIICGRDAFKLHDTYGFPIDLTVLMAEERGLKVDVGEYERLMEEAKERSGRKIQVSAHVVGRATVTAKGVVRPGSTDDQPKWTDDQLTTTYRGWLDGAGNLGDTRISTEPGEKIAILEETCFYSEQGGQVGDCGTIETETGVFEVMRTEKMIRPDRENDAGLVLHIGRVRSGYLDANQEADAKVDPSRRSTKRNHTSTHIMNWALREVLGDHVEQKGSLVDPDKTRFDFSHRKAVSVEELAAIEEKANTQIEGDLEVFTTEVPEAEARKIKTLRAVFGEKYPETVRVVSIGKSYDELIADPENPEWLAYSVEFCGGTHLQRSGEAELFRIIEEASVAKGIRRITAVTGERAKQCDENANALLAEFARVADSPDADLAERMNALKGRVNEDDLPYLERLKLREMLAGLHARVKKHAKKQANSGAKDVRAAAEELLAGAETVGSSKVIVGELPAAGPEQIREAIDYLRTEAGSAGICVGCVVGEKVLLFASLTDDVVVRGLKAGDLIKAVAPLIGGGGGGKPQLAQAGGKNKAGLAQALDSARDWLRAGLQPRS